MMYTFRWLSDTKDSRIEAVPVVQQILNVGGGPYLDSAIHVELFPVVFEWLTGSKYFENKQKNVSARLRKGTHSKKTANRVATSPTGAGTVLGGLPSSPRGMGGNHRESRENEKTEDHMGTQTSHEAQVEMIPTGDSPPEKEHSSLILTSPTRGTQAVEEIEGLMSIKDSNGNAITSVDKNGWYSASKMCASLGVKLDDFLRLRTTQQYLRMLQGNRICDTDDIISYFLLIMSLKKASIYPD